MAKAPETGAVHHLTLTVSDVERSAEFYKRHLGFQEVVRFDPGRVLLSNGATLLAIGPPFYVQEALPDDRFSEFRVGLDHLSLAVRDRAALEEAAVYFDEQGIAHGDVKDLGAGFGLYVMSFRDPDQIQLELTAPYPG